MGIYEARIDPKVLRKTVSVVRDMSIGGLQSITGIGFRAKYISAHATLDGEKTVAFGFYDGIANFCYYYDGSSGGIVKQYNSIALLQPAAGKWRAGVVNSLNNDGAVIDWNQSVGVIGTSATIILEFRG